MTQHKTMHRSLPNVSDHIRWSLDLRYCDRRKPTGRADVPGFVVRSAQAPEAVARAITENFGIGADSLEESDLDLDAEAQGAALGIADLGAPDWGDPVAVDERAGEVPVFWACGVTPQAVVEASKPPLAITHAPGCMFVCDTPNEALAKVRAGGVCSQLQSSSKFDPSS